MAFPTRSTPTWKTGAASSRSFTINLPGTIAAGDLLIAIVAMDDGAGTAVFASSPNDSTSDAWTDLIPSGNNLNRTGAAYYKIADGDEDGGTLSISYTGGFTGEDYIGGVIRVPAADWHGTTAPAATSWQAESNDTTPEFPTLNPSAWDIEDTLWITVLVSNQDLTGIAAPTNYSMNATKGQDWQQAAVGASIPRIAVASRGLDAASAGGGNWPPATNWLTSVDHITAMIAVRPAAGGTASDVTEPASVRVALAGEISEAASVRYIGRGEVIESASMQISSVTTPEPEPVAKTGFAYVTAATAYDKGGSPNLNTQPDLSQWTLSGTPTFEEIDGPVPGSVAYEITDDNGAALEYISRTAGFTNDEDVPWAVEFKQGSAAESTVFAVWDATAGAYIGTVRAVWSGGVPSMTVADGARLYGLYPLRDGYWRAEGTLNTVAPANANEVRVYARDHSGAASQTGSAIVHKVCWGDQVNVAFENAQRVRFRGDVFTMYFASRGFATRSGDQPAHLAMSDRLTQPIAIRRELFAEGRTEGRSRPSIGDVYLENRDGKLDLFREYAFDGRPIVCWKGDISGAFPDDFVRIYEGVQARPSLTRDRVVLRVRDRERQLDAPLQTSRYAGDNALPAGLEGVEDLKDKPKPVLYGKARNVRPPMVNSAKLIYQVHDGAIASLDAVRDRGIVLSTGIGPQWSDVSDPGLGGNVHAMLYDPFRKRFVAFGQSFVGRSSIAISDDQGVTWSLLKSPVTLGNAHGYFDAAMDDGGIIIAVGDDATGNKPLVAVAKDGVNFDQIDVDGAPWTAGGFIRCVAAGNGEGASGATRWLAGGPDKEIATSDDSGATWTSRSLPAGWGATLDVRCAEYGNSLYMIGGEDGAIATSPDAVTWTFRTINAEWSGTADVQAIAYSPSLGRWCAVGDAGECATSDDGGVTWTERTLPFAVNDWNRSVRWLPELSIFVVKADDTGGGESTHFAVSSDGITWTEYSTGLPLHSHDADSGPRLIAYDPVHGVLITGGQDGSGPSMSRAGPWAFAYASQADLLDDTLAPAPGAVGVWLAGGMFRLGSSPAGTVTADATGLGSGSAAEIIEDLLVRRAGLTLGLESRVSTQDFREWTDATGSPVVTKGESDPFGGTDAYLVRDDDGASGEEKRISLGTKTGELRGRIVFKQGDDTPSAIGLAVLEHPTNPDIFDLELTGWTNGEPTSKNVDNGRLLRQIAKRPDGWHVAYFETYRRSHSDEMWAAIRPSNLAADTGDLRLYRFQVWSLDDIEHTEADLMMLDVKNPAQLGYWAGPDDDGVLISDVINEIAATLGMWWGTDRQGRYRFRILESPRNTLNNFTAPNDIDLLHPDGPWTTTNATITPDDRTNPEGLQIVDKLVETTDTGVHRLGGQVPGSFDAESTVTVEFDAYPDERDRIAIRTENRNGTVVTGSVVDLTDGSVVNEATGHSITTEQRGSDGWRIKVSFAIGGGGSVMAFYVGLVSSGTTESYAGTTGNGAHLSAFVLKRDPDVEVNQYGVIVPMEMLDPALPSYRTIVTHSRNHTVQTDLAAGATDAEKERASRPYESEAAVSPGVQDAHPLAVETIVDGLFTTAADAADEAIRRQVLRSVERERYQFGIEVQDDGPGVDLGRVARITHPRFGLGSGRDVVVMTVDPDGARKEARIVGWGSTAEQVVEAEVVVEEPEEPAESFGTVSDLSVVAHGTDFVTLEWTQVQDDQGNPANYNLRYSEGTMVWGDAFGTDEQKIGTAIGQTIQHTFTGLAANTAHEFQLVPYRQGTTPGVDAVYGALSNVTSQTTDQVTGVGTISDLNAAAGDQLASLSWTPATNAQNHQPQYKESASGTWLDFGSALGSTANFVNVTGLTNGTAYDFRIKATGGAETTFSNTDSATPTASSSNLDPGGLQTERTWDGTALPGAGWAFYQAGDKGSLTNGRFRNIYPQGQSQQGVGQAILNTQGNSWFPWLQADILYLSFKVEFDPNWQLNTQTNKVVYIPTYVGGTLGYPIYLALDGAGRWEFRLQGDPQGRTTDANFGAFDVQVEGVGEITGENNVSPTNNQVTYKPGQTQQVELLIYMNDPGVENGKFSLALDGVTVMDYDLGGEPRYIFGDTQKYIIGVHYDPIWGGGGSVPIQQDMYLDIWDMIVKIGVQ